MLEEQPATNYPGGIVAEISWLIVILFIALGFYSLSAPPPNEAVTSERFSAAAAMQHIEVIAQEPHPMGSPDIAQVREYIVGELEQLGLTPELQPSQAPDPFFHPGPPVDVVNVIARIPGQNGDSAVALVAHYDTHPRTPGANDNTAAVAVLLESARVVLAGEPVANDVILLFTDGEEPSPRFGANAFLETHRDAADIGFVVNFEALGGSGPSMVAETSGAESWVIAEYAAAVDRPVAFSFAPEIARAIGDIGTDFDPFRNAGIPGLHLVYMRGSPIYHTPEDNIESVSLSSLQHHGDNAVGIVRRFGDLDLEVTQTTTTAAYFTLRPAFVIYPAWIGWVIVVAAIGALTVGLRGAALSPGRVLAATGRTLLGAIGASLIGTLLWILTTMVRDTPVAIESYGYLFLIGGVVVWLASRFARNRDPLQNRIAVGLTWVLLGLLTVATLPGTSYLFVWPALALGIAANLQSNSRKRMLGFAVTAAATALLLVPAVEFFWQSGQPRPGNPDSSIPAVAAVAFWLVALAGTALRSVWWQPAES